MSQAEKKRAKVSENSPAMIRIGGWFKRKCSTLWSVYESEALEQIGEIDSEDFATLERYYTAKIPQADNFRRRDVMTLLNNWSGEIDRARNYLSTPRHPEGPRTYLSPEKPRKKFTLADAEAANGLKP